MKLLLVMLMLVISLFGIENGTYNVIKVVDGDTIDIETNNSKVRVRLAFIDTMESMKNARAKKISSNCNIDIDDIIEDGIDSKHYLMNLILTKEVNIIFYGIDSTGRRQVGEIFLPGDIESINIKMIKHGKAVPYYTYIKRFKKDINFYRNIKVENESYVINDECVKAFLGD